MNPDQTKLHFHPDRIAQWQKADTWEKAKEVYPLYVEISPVGACNHRCSFCAVDYLGYKPITQTHETLMLRIGEMANLGVKSIMFAGEGEPLLYKRINDLVVKATTHGIDVSFTTNGVLLDKLTEIARCSWVKVSCNAGTRETYAKVHQTKPQDWDAVWENLKAAVPIKGRCELNVQMVGLPENHQEWRSLWKLAKSAGLDNVVLKPYSQHKSSITTKYQDERVVFHVERGLEPPVFVRDGSASHEEQTYKTCHSTPNFWAYISATGDVYSCSAYLLDDRFKLGNINEQTFREIWQGEKRRKNWEFVRNELDISECRKNCRMHRSNEYLWQLANPQQDVNFV